MSGIALRMLLNGSVDKCRENPYQTLVSSELDTDQPPRSGPDLQQELITSWVDLAAGSLIIQ